MIREFEEKVMEIEGKGMVNGKENQEIGKEGGEVGYEV